jgi:hypothetical protein
VPSCHRGIVASWHRGIVASWLRLGGRPRATGAMKTPASTAAPSSSLPSSLGGDDPEEEEDGREKGDGEGEGGGTHPSDLTSHRSAGRFLYDQSKIPARQVRRLHEIAAFYDDDMCSLVLVPMVTQTMDISLRMVDWLLVNWAKKNKILTRTPDGKEVINIYSTYKDHLKHYRRKLFDPFRRRERIYFAHPRDPATFLSTTVGQLNFTFWAVKYGIFETCRKHLDAIETDMVTMLAESKKRRKEESTNGHKRKRTELSSAPKNKVHVYIVRHDVDFECHRGWEPEARALQEG